MTVFPNVKINLGLHVLCRRPDGFHDIETLFVPYHGICDTLEIVELPDDGKGKARFVPSASVTWDNDLTVRAYDLLAKDYDLPSVEIRLTKNAPVGAGLGGGSSDAAFCLKALNEMFSLQLSDSVLASYASRLGSDCAFFIYNRPMLGTGRGEILTPLDLDLGGYEIKVVVPEGISVSTPEAYRGIKPRYDYGSVQEGPSLKEILSAPISQWRDCLVNDFEKTVFAIHPRLAEMKENLYRQGAEYAAMSGSGSALFGLFSKVCK